MELGSNKVVVVETSAKQNKKYDRSKYFDVGISSNEKKKNKFFNFFGMKGHLRKKEWIFLKKHKTKNNNNMANMIEQELTELIVMISELHMTTINRYVGW